MEEEGEGDTGPQWGRTDPSLVGTNIPPYQSPVFSDSDLEKLEEAQSALDYYELFQPQSFLNYVVSESRTYAVSRGMESKIEQINSCNIR